ncbi:MAG TPA: hypothetical protein PLJ60_20600 [Chryseolinea sp.]|nr:hypothetical protein [Chryseolinea sp.]
MARKKKQTEEEIENLKNTTNESDDTFGLPEIEYEPLKRDEPVVEEPVVEETKVVEEESRSYYQETETTVAEEEEQYVPHYMQEEEPSKTPMILGILAGVVLVAAAVWFFAFYQPQIKAEEERERAAAQIQLEKANKLAEEKRIADQLIQDAEKRVADSLAAIANPSIGSIETLSERSGRYYVVVSSAIDDDLIMDYATDLSKKGVSSKIIPPFGKTKFYRIAIDVADTYADAQANADSKKGGDFGNDVWVVKY